MYTLTVAPQIAFSFFDHPSQLLEVVYLARCQISQHSASIDRLPRFVLRYLLLKQANSGHKFGALAFAQSTNLLFHPLDFALVAVCLNGWGSTTCLALLRTSWLRCLL